MPRESTKGVTNSLEDLLEELTFGLALKVELFASGEMVGCGVAFTHQESDM